MPKKPSKPKGLEARPRHPVVLLACGHEVAEPPPVSTPSGEFKWVCPVGCGLQKRKLAA